MNTTTIRAKLTGSDRATAAGFTATGAAPVLVLCRQLLAAGLDPDRAMYVYRGTTLALRVKSIRAAADLEVNSKGTGFIRHRAVRAASTMRDSPEAIPQQSLQLAKRAGGPARRKPAQTSLDFEGR